MERCAVVLVLLLAGSGCASSTETTAPVTTTSFVTTTKTVPATTAVTTTIPSTTTQAPTTAALTTTSLQTPTTSSTTTVAATTDDWIADLLTTLQISDPISQTDYNRDDWGSGWSDADGDCINTRHAVLILESLVETNMDPSGCKVLGGQWFAAFTGSYANDPGSLDIDHFVPLANAHASGGWAWSLANKRDYYNDLSDPRHLIAVTASANRSKGSRGPDEWKPPDKNYWCQYAHSWAEIKVRWKLSVTGNELTALQAMLGTCNGVPADSTPSRPVATATTISLTTSVSDALTDPGNSKNCGDFSTYAEAKAWFDTYFPSYGDVAKLDGDNDGEPCESLSGAP